MLRLILITVGIVLAACGGVVAYRALFLEPSTAIMITDTQVRELPNYTRIIGGTVLLITGFAVAFFVARRTR